MKKYLISGIGPGSTGVGRLLNYLIPLATKYGYTIIFPSTRHSVKLLLQEKKYLEIFLEMTRRYFGKIMFFIKVKNIKDAEVLYIHPNTIGYNLLFELINRNTINKIFIMDNSFFCIKAYNFINDECVICLNDISKIDNSCMPITQGLSKSKAIEDIEKFLKYSADLDFFVQNRMQKLLIKKRFGETTKVSVIGMNTGEFDEKSFQGNKDINKIVFHGSMEKAKGFEYALKLAEKLPQYKFIFPLENINNIKLNNVEFKPCRWESGLKEEIESASLVLCTSIWSAPIEGALLKSIRHNGNVAVYTNQFGFANELPNDIVLKLSTDVNASVEKIKVFFDSKIDFTKKSNQWLDEFLDTMELEKLFI